MKAIVTNDHRQFVLSEVAEPQPRPGELLVAVEAISINRGDLRLAQAQRSGFRAGWDFSGTVLQSSGRNSPPEGCRVCGLMPGLGAWGERIAVPTANLAIVPDGVTLEQAAALPVVGLTALYTLERFGSLLGKRVLITGASGGVGHVAGQLARLAGAKVTGLTRSDDGAAMLKRIGITNVAQGEGPDAAAAFGPFDAILESVGGASLGESIKLLAPRGTCLVFGASAGGAATPIDAFAFYQKQLNLAGFGLFPEMETGKSAAAGLARLLPLLADGRLSVDLAPPRPWSAIADVADALSARGFTGKAVLQVS